MSVWIGTSTSILLPLRKLQRWALSTATNTRISKDDHSAFREFGVLPLQQWDSWDFSIFSWIYKILHAVDLPGYSQLLHFRESGLSNLRLPLCVISEVAKTNMWQRSFCSRAASLSEKLPEKLFDVLKTGSLDGFQHRVKHWLISTG